MRKVLLISLLVLIKLTASAQRVRVFNFVGFDGNFSKTHSAPDIQIGQSLLMDSRISFRLNTAVSFSGDFIHRGAIPNIDKSRTISLDLKKTHFVPTLSIPVGAEIGFRNVALGVAVELLSINIGKSLDSLNYTVIGTEQPIAGLEVSPAKFNFIAAKDGFRSLDAILYLSYTYNDTFSFRLGLSRQGIMYRSFITTASRTSRFDKFGFEEVKPFIGIRFNIEK